MVEGEPLQADLALAAVGVTEEILVTGYRAAQANALQDKRMAAMIKETLTADDAGKLPDQNVAEALRRVTGVTATVDQGEGRYVTVRGVDPSYTNITLDNQVIGSPEDTRRVALDTIPSEVLSRVEVVKAVTPDMDGHAVGNHKYMSQIIGQQILHQGFTHGVSVLLRGAGTLGRFQSGFFEGYSQARQAFQIDIVGENRAA